MSSPYQSLADLLGIVLRPRIFMSYYHDGDQWYYDQLSTLLHDQYSLVTDRSLDDEIDSDDCDYVMRRIREDFITGTSCTFVLFGTQTWTRKYVDWETKATLDKEHGLIGVALPGFQYAQHLVPRRLWDNYMSGYAVLTDWWTISANTQSVPGFVTEATAKPSFLINNSREMMSCNDYSLV
jgi:hypothetical protein